MRIDSFLFESKKYPSRTKAQEAVSRGEVSVNGRIILKPSYEVCSSDKIEISELALNFVSNGGYKLEKALSEFPVDAFGKIFCDVGASAGGFTDCLLRRGAKKVYAVDVGDSLLADDLKCDERVVVIDNYNARFLDREVLGGKVDAVVCDVSFISLTYLLKPIFEVIGEDGFAITLIKPQFEVGKKALNKNGIVTRAEDRKNAVKKIYEYGISVGLYPKAFTTAPIVPEKNVEYLILWTKSASDKLPFEKFCF
ncbi:MAG: TlyA family RNA methyltransferase [Clostridia bacterium]|nr:TlyA family RNA methyltransferase [Clostridia bacterium]